MWAVHALVLGKKPKAVFWCLLLPLCVVQIHYSGVALTAVDVDIATSSKGSSGSVTSKAITRNQVKALTDAAVQQNSLYH